MKQYIDKSAVVAEIEKLQNSIMDEDGNFYSAKAQAEYNILCMLEDSIDTLEVKEEPVGEDLDEASVNYAATGKFLPNGKEMIDFQLEKAFKAGAKWQEEQIVLNNKEYHRVPSTTLKRLYMNEAKYELLKSDIMEGIVGDFEKGTTHSYLTIKIPMLLCPSNCAKGDKVKLIIVMEE